MTHFPLLLPLRLYLYLTYMPLTRCTFLTHMQDIPGHSVCVCYS